MCGIAGTVYKRDFSPGIEVKASELEEVFLAVKENEQNVHIFLEKCWQYKSNINFLRYCTNKGERERIDGLCEKIEILSRLWLKALPLIDKSNSSQFFKDKYREYESLLDCRWFLACEMSGWFENIKYFLGGKINQASASSIIFYKNVITVVNAIDNRLEFRGRDSLGISIQLVLNGLDARNYGNATAMTDSESVYFEERGKDEIVTFVFKTANPIGSLGDNAKVIKELIKNNVILREIIHGNSCEYGSIVIHTRWASVGEVNVSNCHPVSNVSCGGTLSRPLILASMNGDIYNYKELLRNHFDQGGLLLDKDCTTDCLAIPVSLSSLRSLTIESVRDVMNTFAGSFAMAVQGSDLPGEIVLSNRGRQGLYIGVSYDNIMFASDVYGLIESCRYFSPIKSGSILSISRRSPIYNDDFNLKLTRLDEGEEDSIRAVDLKTTTITTRDIDKGKFDHFLEKEIRETKDIVQKTILGYLQNANPANPEDRLHSVVIDKSQVPDPIIEKFKTNQIKKIIITGMGTCYTAAAAIAMYMRDMLRDYGSKDLQVEPHIASEGSAFYLQPVMNDTLVIVIAQSGTTVDTNVYVQMAKERGAMSLAVANKREGDVTFIVDGTLYIGSGRDIEIAVPSTKTYTAQVILGYILTLYLCSRLADKTPFQQERLAKNIDLLMQTPALIDATFRRFDENKNLQIMRNNVCRYNSWYVVHDDSPNSVCAMEIRIKYSEGCYHTLPYMHLDQILRNKVEGSFLTYMTNRELGEVEEHLIKVLRRNNSLIVIGHFHQIPDRLAPFVAENRLSLIDIPSADPFFSFIPTIVTGQLLSYYAALALDERKNHFKELIDAVKNYHGIEGKWENFLSQLAQGTFDEGFSIVQFLHLKELYEEFKKNGFRQSSEEQIHLLRFLNKLYQFARRPIDTIKHQAKTITVGAVRETHPQPAHSVIPLNEKTTNKKRGAVGAGDTEIGNLLARINAFDDRELFTRMRLFKDFFIYLDGLDESYGNFIVNFFSEINNKYNLNANFRVAKYYELSIGTVSHDEFWICVTDGISPKCLELLNGLEGRHVVFDFATGGSDSFNKSVPKLSKSNDIAVDYALGCLYLVNVIVKGLFDSTGVQEQWETFAGEKLKELESAWDYICYSPQVKEEIHYAAKIFFSKRNWKCIGSGINYNASKFAANKLTSSLHRSCAFDIFENHKHIDISAEAAILVFIANIWREGYQSDVLSEIEKLISHNNIPVIITNLGDKRFDDLVMKVDYGIERETVISLPIIRVPKLSEIYSFPLNLLLVNKIVDELKAVSVLKNLDLFSTIALREPSDLELCS